MVGCRPSTCPSGTLLMSPSERVTNVQSEQWEGSNLWSTLGGVLDPTSTFLQYSHECPMMIVPWK